jgi:uncharacterized protein with PIN domain
MNQNSKPKVCPTCGGEVYELAPEIPVWEITEWKDGIPFGVNAIYFEDVYDVFICKECYWVGHYDNLVYKEEEE